MTPRVTGDIRLEPFILTPFPMLLFTLSTTTLTPGSVGEERSQQMPIVDERESGFKQGEEASRRGKSMNWRDLIG